MESGTPCRVLSPLPAVCYTAFVLEVTRQEFTRQVKTTIELEKSVRPEFICRMLRSEDETARSGAMHRLEATVTEVVLVLAFAFRQAWLAPLLAANSVVGFVYMTRERHVLRTAGARHHGMAIKLPLSLTSNVLINILSHALLPAIALARMNWAGGIAWWKVWTFEVVSFVCIDLGRVYPARGSLVPYIAAHAICLAELQRLDK